MNLAALANRVKRGFIKNKQNILIGTGIGGFFATTILAVKATPKALVKIEERKRELDTDKLELMETVKTAGPCYIPAAVTGTASTVVLILAGREGTRRAAALTAACNLSETALRTYRDKVVETVGEEKEKEIHKAVTKEYINQNPMVKKEIIVTGNGNVLCYDSISGRYFYSSMEKIEKAVNDINYRMMGEMYISLNDFYYELGLPPIKIGEDVGWNTDKGLLEVDFTSHVTDDGLPCLVVDYQVVPGYDYN